MKCKQFTTYAANGEAIQDEKEIKITMEADEASHLESGVLNIYPDITFQRIDDFGGAMTETSAYLFTKMDAATRKAALREFFGEEGNHFKYLRVHMDSCDFSLEEYAAVEDPMTDPELKSFSLKRTKCIFCLY